MKRIIVQLNDGSHINIPADRMERDGDYLIAFSGDKMVAFIDVSAVIVAHMSEKGAAA